MVDDGVTLGILDDVTGTIVDNNSADVVAAGAWAISTTIGGGGIEVVAAGATAIGTTICGGGTENVLSGGAAIGVDFYGNGGLLTLGQPTCLSGIISGLAVGDIIDFANATITSAVVSGTNVALTFAGGLTADLTLAASLPAGDCFSLEPDGGGGSELVVTALANAGTAANLATSALAPITAVFAGPLSEYSIAASLGSDGLMHTDATDNGAAGDGPLDLVNIQQLQFSDQTLSAPPSLQCLTTPEQQVEAMYVAYFGRAGDVAGTNFWTTNLETGQTIDDVAMNFSKSPEAETLYPFLASPATATGSDIHNFIECGI